MPTKGRRTIADIPAHGGRPSQVTPEFACTESEHGKGCSSAQLSCTKRKVQLHETCLEDLKCLALVAVVVLKKYRVASELRNIVLQHTTELDVSVWLFFEPTVQVVSGSLSCFCLLVFVFPTSLPRKNSPFTLDPRTVWANPTRTNFATWTSRERQFKNAISRAAHARCGTTMLTPPNSSRHVLDGLQLDGGCQWIFARAEEIAEQAPPDIFGVMPVWLPAIISFPLLSSHRYNCDALPCESLVTRLRDVQGSGHSFSSKVVFVRLLVSLRVCLSVYPR